VHKWVNVRTTAVRTDIHVNARTFSVPGVAPRKRTAGVKDATSAAYLQIRER
jgi:hypothetical protein